MYMLLHNIYMRLHLLYTLQCLILVIFVDMETNQEEFLESNVAPSVSTQSGTHLIVCDRKQLFPTCMCL